MTRGEEPTAEVSVLPTGDSGPDLASAAGDEGREADRRRWRIVRMLSETPGRIVTIDELRHDRNFRRGLTHFAETTLEEDFRQIESLFGHGGTIERVNGTTLRLVERDECLFADRGYRLLAPSDPELARDVTEKRAIGQYVAARLLRTDPLNPGVVNGQTVYLSTGSTVHQVAVALLKGADPHIKVLISDNLVVLEHICRSAPYCPWINDVRVEIPGGHAQLAEGDIVLEHYKQLRLWEISTAVFGATGVHPESGRIYSFRQWRTKSWILRNMLLAKVIFAVTPPKFEAGGGRLIYDPHAEQKAKREYHIVTTHLADSVVKRLESHGYHVHLAAPQAGAPR